MEALAGTTAVDAGARVFYALMHSSSSSSPSRYPSMDLVQLDLAAGGRLTASPRACADCTACPLSLVGA